MVVVQGNKNTFYSILFNTSLNLFAFIHRITTFLPFMRMDKLLFAWIKSCLSGVVFLKDVLWLFSNFLLFCSFCSWKKVLCWFQLFFSLYFLVCFAQRSWWFKSFNSHLLIAFFDDHLYYCWWWKTGRVIYSKKKEELMKKDKHFLWSSLLLDVLWREHVHGCRTGLCFLEK